MFLHLNIRVCLLVHIHDKAKIALEIAAKVASVNVPLENLSKIPIFKDKVLDSENANRCAKRARASTENICSVLNVKIESSVIYIM
jgi:uncharacterized protein YwgA